MKCGKVEKETLSDNEKPTLNQFKYYFYHGRNRDLKKEKEYLNNCKGRHSSSLTEVIGPGFKYQIDATVADVYLVNRFDRKSIIGRPIVYIAVEVFSTIRALCETNHRTFHIV